MDIEQKKLVKEIFINALEKPQDQMNSYINSSTDDDEVLRQINKLIQVDKCNKFKTHDALNANKVVENTMLFPTDRYKLLEKIGQGGMGDVYLAQRKIKDIKQNVAIKILKFSDELSKQRFSQETSILSQLSHPNISNFIDAEFLADGRPYVVMEYTQGRALTDYCKHRQIDIEGRLSLFLKLCHAIEYAHRNLIIHRDLKPSNILVTKNGQLKLIDFGIAKIQQDSGHNTQTHLRAMTPAYASPEQFLGKSVNVSSDVYSLGVILYELLTDKLPNDFDNQSFVEFEKQLHKPLVKPSDKIDLIKPKNEVDHKRKKRLQGDLDKITIKALQVDITQRYYTAAELIDDLNRYKNNLPIKAQHPSWNYKINKFFKRNTLSVVSGSFLFFLIAVFVFILVQQNKELTNQRNVAISEQERAEIISSTFTQAFKNADPTQTNGKDIKAIDIMDQAADLLIKNETLNPVSKAHLTITVAEVLKNLSEHDKALDILNLIESDLESLPRKDKIKFAAVKSLSLLSVSHNENKAIDTITQARSELGEDPMLAYVHARVLSHMTLNIKVQQVLEKYVNSLPVKHELYVPICTIYADAVSSSGNYEKGQITYDKCFLASEHESNKSTMWEKSVLLYHFGLLQIWKEEYEKAKETFEKAREIRVKLFNPTHFSVTNIERYIGKTFVLLGQTETALLILDKAITNQKTYIKKWYEAPAIAMNPSFEKSLAYYELKEYKKAAEILQSLIEFRTALNARKLSKTALYLFRYGMAHSKLNHINQAIQAFTESIDILDQERYKSQTRFAEEAAQTKVYLAQCYFIIKKYQMSRKLLDEAIPQIYYSKDNAKPKIHVTHNSNKEDKELLNMIKRLEFDLSQLTHHDSNDF